MKISLDWLSQYVDLPDPAEELIDVLPMLGIEVEEGDEGPSVSLDKVVVGKVVEKTNIPKPTGWVSVQLKLEQSYPPNCLWCHQLQTRGPVPVALPGLNYLADLKSKIQAQGSGIGRHDVQCQRTGTWGRRYRSFYIIRRTGNWPKNHRGGFKINHS